MTTLREAAQKALEALEDMLGWESLAPQSVQASSKQSLQRLREALAEPEPVPVAWMDREGDLYKMPEIEGWAPPHTMLYTAPPQRKPLTDEEILKIWNDMGNDPIAPSVFSFIACVRKTEQAHGIA